jgi:hypothetical protein
MPQKTNPLGKAVFLVPDHGETVVQQTFDSLGSHAWGKSG